LSEYEQENYPETELTVKGGGHTESCAGSKHEGRVLVDRSPLSPKECPHSKHVRKIGKAFVTQPTYCGRCGRPTQHTSRMKLQCRSCSRVFTASNTTSVCQSNENQAAKKQDLKSNYAIPPYALNRRYRCPWCSLEGSIGRGLAVSDVNKSGEPRVDVPKETVLQCGCGQLSVLSANSLLRYSKEDY
jgi:hypothetical protein